MLGQRVQGRGKGTTRDGLAYWSDFYAGSQSAEVPSSPSPFAAWVDEQLDRGTAVTELGFGSARDTFWLAGQGHRLVGFDGADSAVRLAQSRVRRGDDLDFRWLDLTDRDAVDHAAGRVRRSEAAEVVYARFLLHSLPEEGRDNVLRLASKGLVSGGRLFLEFRTGQDAEAEHAFGDDHFRAYLDPEEVADRIAGYGGRVTHLEQGHGLAPYKSEDPHVARIVASWGPPEPGL